MKRLIALVTVSVMSLLGLIAVGGPAGAGNALTNGKIAFGRWKPALDDSQIFTINPDGTGERKLLSGGAESPRWSPDGTKIAVTLTGLPGGPRTATLNPDGSGYNLLDPSFTLNLTCQAWSPDGKRLACAGFGENPSQTDGLYTVRASDGGDIKQLTTYPNGTLDAQFTNDIPLGYSPDGSRILFDRNHNNDRGSLFVVNTDGTHLRRLNPGGLKVASDQGDGWSPDGSQVTFAAFFKLSAGNGSGTALYVVNADGTGLHRVTPSGLGAFRATWSPDGQLIAFNSKFRSDVQIWVVHPDGTGLTSLTSGNADVSFSLVWSPDGTTLVFQRLHWVMGQGQEDLWTMNRDGSGLLRLTNTPSPSDEGGADWGTALVG
jgi:Tol biopolymer transport system component